jgi:hypothetical protein
VFSWDPASPKGYAVAKEKDFMKTRVNISFEVPCWLEYICVCPLLIYRRLRFGYTFRKIPLTQNQVTIVDPKDYYWLVKYNWFACRSLQTWYAHRAAKINGKRSGISMHCQIMPLPKGLLVDHANGDGLDNRRDNLRPATPAENAHNRRKYSTPTSSKFKGVRWHKCSKQWAVSIVINHKSVFIGYFDIEIEAAKAYDAAARKYHGEFARLNFS